MNINDYLAQIEAEAREKGIFNEDCSIEDSPVVNAGSGMDYVRNLEKNAMLSDEDFALFESRVDIDHISKVMKASDKIKVDHHKNPILSQYAKMLMEEREADYVGGNRRSYDEGVMDEKIREYNKQEMRKNAKEVIASLRRKENPEINSKFEELK